jgi:hypothetical protein
VANAQPQAKRKKSEPASKADAAAPARPAAPDKAPGGDGEGAADAKKAPKRVPPGRLKLMFAGELVLVKNPDRDLAGLFRRYEALFEAFANMEKPERILNYKLLSALMLTSHAKKAVALEDKKRLFDLKNRIYLHLANDRDARRKLAFMYLTSKNFRVTEFCEACVAKNTEAGLKRHNWKFCKSCKIDRNFYNVLSMHHKFKDGSATIFLSNDLVPEVKGLQVKKKGKLDDITEEALFQRYHYNVRNLDAFELKSVEDWVKRLIPGIATGPGAAPAPGAT